MGRLRGCLSLNGLLFLLVISPHLAGCRGGQGLRGRGGKQLPGRWGDGDGIKDVYDIAVMKDAPHAYWRMSPVSDGISPIGRRRWIVADYSGLPPIERGKLQGLRGAEGQEEEEEEEKQLAVAKQHGRFAGWTDEDTEGCPRHMHCAVLANTTAKGIPGDGYAALNSMGGRIWVPSFYMPPAEEFTVELWFQPACTVTNRTRGQVLFRTLDPAAMLSPQVSIQGGNVVLEALLSDPVIPNQYFSAMVRLEAPPPPAAAGGEEGWGEWGSASWHHVAFTVNVTHAAAYRNGTLVASQEIPNQVSGSGTRILGIPTDSPQAAKRVRLGVIGAGMGLGFNGAIKRVAVYNHSLDQGRVEAHFNAASWRLAPLTASPSPGGDGTCLSPDGVRGYCPRAGPSADEAGCTGCAMAFYSCRASEIPEARVHGNTSRILAGVCVLAAFFSLLIALFVHMEWCDQTANVAAPEILTIQEQLPVDASRANYPLAVLTTTSLLLPVAYLSIPYEFAVVRASDMRPVYLLPYLLWALSEACGVILLIAASHRVGQRCGLFLALVSAATPVLALLSQFDPTFGWCPPNDTTVERAFESAQCFSREELPISIILMLTLVPAFAFLRPLRGIGSVQTRLAPCSPSAAIFRGLAPHTPLARDEVAALIPSSQDPNGGRSGLIRVLKRARDYLEGDAGADRDRRGGVVGLLMGWFFSYACMRRVAWFLADAKRDPGLDPWVKFGSLTLCDAGCCVALALITAQTHAFDWPQHVWDSLRQSDDSGGSSIVGSLHSIANTPSMRLAPREVMDWGGAINDGQEENNLQSEWPAPNARGGEGSRLIDLEQQLRSMGFAVWKGPDGQGVHATFNGEFVVMRRVGMFLVLVCSISLGAILVVSNSTLVLTRPLPLGCWDTGADLLPLSTRRPGLNETYKETVTCPWKCFKALNTEFDSAELSKGGLSQPGSGPYWGWNEVYGGRRGDGIYSEHSAVCRAAVHAGVFPPGAGAACLTVSRIPSASFFPGGTRNGVTARTLDLPTDEEGGGLEGAMVVEHTPEMCPFSLRWYAALLLLPITAAIVMICSSPFVTWLLLSSVAFWFEAFLDQQTSPAGSASFERGVPIYEYLLLLPLLCGYYLLGPAHSIRAPPWQAPYFTSSFPIRNKHTLPRPAKTPRELITRNLVCFMVPMLVGTHLESVLSNTIFDGLALAPGAIGNVKNLGVGPTIALVCLGLGGLAIATINILAIRRAGGLKRLAAMYLACVAIITLVTYLLSRFHHLHVHHYIFFAALGPLGARDSHFGAATQGLVIGIAMQGAAQFGPASLWPYSPPRSF